MSNQPQSNPEVVILETEAPFIGVYDGTYGFSPSIPVQSVSPPEVIQTGGEQFKLTKEQGDAILARARSTGKTQMSLAEFQSMFPGAMGGPKLNRKQRRVAEMRARQVKKKPRIAKGK